MKFVIKTLTGIRIEVKRLSSIKMVSLVMDGMLFIRLLKDVLSYHYLYQYLKVTGIYCQSHWHLWTLSLASMVTVIGIFCHFITFVHFNIRWLSPSRQFLFTTIKRWSAAQKLGDLFHYAIILSLKVVECQRFHTVTWILDSTF